MPILTVGGEKGGPGKTTIATTLAALRAATGASVVLVNTDPQNTAGYWADERKGHADVPPVMCVSLHGSKIHSELRSLAQRYDDVIVDGGGRDSPELRSALVVTDRLLMPLRPSQFDLWTVPKMDQLIDQADSLNPGLAARVVVNQVPPSSRDRLRREMAEALSPWPRFQLLDTLLSSRAAYANAASLGLAVTEMKPRDAKACTEVAFLYKEMFHAAEAAVAP